MATWSEIKNYLHQNYRWEEIDTDLLKGVWDLDGGRSHMVFVALANDSTIMMAAPVCDYSPANVAKVLENNTSIYGIFLLGGMVCLVDPQNIGTIDADELEGFKGVLLQADALEQSLFGGDKY
jgi:hypothetical protein